MPNFLQQHLQLTTVDSRCNSPEPVRPNLDFPWPSEFRHLADPPRGTNFDSRGFPVKKTNPVDRTIFKVISEVDRNSGPVKLINP